MFSEQTFSLRPDRNFREAKDMSYMVDGYYGETAATAPVSERVQFIRRTYLHVFGAVLALIGIEAALLSSKIGEDIINTLFRGNVGLLGLMVLFVGGGYAAQWLARSRQSIGMQYAGLSLYVLLEAIIFLPLLTKATSSQFAGQYLPIQAGIVTLAVFAGLTASVFWSGRDFSFMGPMLAVGGMVAIGVIVAAMIFGFTLGLLFSGLMVALAAGYIIYDTSNIIHQYRTDEYVGASLNLFASVALMYYYILRIFMSARSN
jgi:uncharacterized protein